VDRQNARGQKNAIKHGPVETAVERFGRNWDGQYSAFMICYPRSRFQSHFVFF